MFQIYRGRAYSLDHAQPWRWRFVAKNGKIMADSGEGYSSEANVRRAIKRFRQLLECGVETREAD